MALDIRQVALGIDTGHFPFLARLFAHHAHAVAHGHRDDVGQVVLALMVVVPQPGQPSHEMRCRHRHDAAVDFPDLALLVAGILLLHDRLHVAVMAAQDAPVAGRVALFHSQQRQVLFRMFQQGFAGFCLQQRHIAQQHQGDAVRIQPGDGLPYGMAGSQLFGLQDPLDFRPGDGIRHFFATKAVHHHDPVRVEQLRTGNDMGENRTSRHLMQHFGQIGMHAGATAGGKDEDVEFFVSHGRQV
ncbi:hypothetical protein GALL_398650 [mine drainage metagenome]|uniref:Uncharacterized protein n=1 Tax=mine drainage metagenome TaxID=410659 RepID=A0A1J5QEN2_9ZZZZ